MISIHGRTGAAIVLRCLLLATIPAWAGCGGSAFPETYPVTGKVIYKGGEPMPGGIIQFSSRNDPQSTVAGSIQPDGTFTLSTVIGVRKVAGALPGRYRVRVAPPQRKNQDLTQIRQPSALYEVEPKDNDFVIEVEKLPVP